MTETETTYSGPQRIFSGVQPTGQLHLGNYLGALTKFVTLQDRMESIFCVVDLHAITMPQDPKLLADQTRSIAAAFIAAGIDTDKAIVFAQSSVPQHMELAWYFNCVARMGWLERMIQFKEKAGKDKERASVGLFDYPVLQAADILVYKATHVPVGEDQKQHLELSRQIADKFNRDFDAPGFFPLPEPVIEGPGARIMSLKDGTKKMSKSDPSDLSRINLTDDADMMAKKIRKAKTDPEPLPETMDELKARPEAANLVGIYAALSGEPDEAVLTRFAGKGFGVFKPELADLVVDKLAPVTKRYADLLASPSDIDTVLARGGERAESIASGVVAETRDRIGLWRG